MQPEMFAKLAAKITNHQQRVDGQGQDHIEVEDLAHALGLVPAHVAAAVKTRACPEYARDLHHFLMSFARESGTKLGPKLDALAWMVVHDFIHPPHCPTCRGRREIPANLSDGATFGVYPMQACPQCDGAGIQGKSDFSQARRLGVSLTEWKRKYMKKYDKMMACVTGWEVQGLCELTERLR